MVCVKLYLSIFLIGEVVLAVLESEAKEDKNIESIGFDSPLEEINLEELNRKIKEMVRLMEDNRLLTWNLLKNINNEVIDKITNKMETSMNGLKLELSNKMDTSISEIKGNIINLSEKLTSEMINVNSKIDILTSDNKHIVKDVNEVKKQIQERSDVDNRDIVTGLQQLNNELINACRHNKSELIKVVQDIKSDNKNSHQCGDPRSYRCVPDFQCRGGEIIRDGDGLIDVRVSQGGTTPRPVICVNSRYPYVLSHCCHIPGTPVIQAPTDFCDGGRKCVRSSLCSADGTINKDGSGLIDKKSGQATCLINKKDIGVCCSPTVHKPQNVIDYCPDGGQCVAFEGCNGNSMNFHNVYKYHSDSSLLRPCKLGRRINGICCLKKHIPQIGQCGVSNHYIDTRIISNTAFKDYEAGFAEFPWQAIIFSTGFSFVCGATLISDRFLLTAAHCLDDGVLPSSLSVRLGEWKVNGEEEELPFVDIDVAAITIHPKFNRINVHNGIAVLELVHPVTFNFHISTLCTPASGSLPSPSTRCIATGWGKNAFRTGAYQHILKKVELPFISHDECQNLLRRTLLGKFYRHHESFVCAGGEENREFCKGDIGGPLACYNEAIGKYELIGITAWGVGCGVKDVPEVFINVPFFTDWINEVTGGV